MNGRRIAVAGMGRSGVGIARAALKRGALVTVYDEKSADTPERIQTAEELQSLGAQLVTGWHGRLDPADFDLLVPSPGFRDNHPALMDAQLGGREIIGEIEFSYQISAAPILAITGTNGKSTTTVLAWLLAREVGLDALLCGNLSGSGYPELTLTEAADRATDQQWLVAEVSSFQLERVDSFRPKVACVTNVTPDHMDRHPSFEHYFETKMRLLTRMGPGDVVVVNDREPSVNSTTLTGLIPEAIVSRIGPGEPVDYDTNGIYCHGQRVELSGTALEGLHGAANSAVAWALVAATGAEMDQAKAARTFGSFRGLSNRMERVAEKGGVLFINNSMCTNPAAVIASTRSLARTQTLLMGGNTKGLDFSPVGEYLRECDHRVVLFGPSRAQMERELGVEWPYRETLEEAFRFAAEQSRPGEAVVLSPGCASAFPFPSFRERGEAFRQIVLEWTR